MMKRLIVSAGIAFLLAFQVAGQAPFLFNNFGAPTRIGSVVGPLAGPDIWAQMLAGPLPDSLAPVGAAQAHSIYTNGIVIGREVTVPTVPCNSLGYVQMLAWDSTLWGTALSGVPADQLGMTDIVRVSMGCFPGPVEAPSFRTPAIVPVPEPSVFALAILGGVVLAFRLCTGQRRPRHVGSG